MMMMIITRMWVDKMSLPLHPSIADRLATDMATLATHYHQTHAWKRSARRPTTPTTRLGLPPAIRHRHTAFTPQQRRNQRNNSRAKERRALAQLSLATVATTPLITQFFQSVKTKAADACSLLPTDAPSFLPSCWRRLNTPPWGRGYPLGKIAFSTPVWILAVILNPTEFLKKNNILYWSSLLTTPPFCLSPSWALDGDPQSRGCKRTWWSGRATIYWAHCLNLARPCAVVGIIWTIAGLS